MRLHGYNNEIEYIKIHETEKSGLSLQITKASSTLFKKVISQILNSDSNAKKIVIKEPHFEFSLCDIKFSSASSSCDEIDFTELNKVSKDILHYKEQMNTLITETYLQILQQIEKKWFHDLENLGNFIAKMDVLQCKSYIAKYYNYCKPEIVMTESSKSFVNAFELRHCLIEHLQQNELYVTNDISLGNTLDNVNNKDGILLYGTNAVGKTSLIRALGIAIILAQSGMFVPCSRFQYKPYHSIFSRILGNDNIFKGLSTFAVEMSELRIILKMADENSLILGDELCSGTETESAMSIFVAGLMELHEKESSFIFATHFHEIINFEEIKSLQRLDLKHMSVIYDRAQDCLIYDRKLKDGPGTKTYGLEVCKSLYLSENFLNRAYAIRNKYYPETRGELSHDVSRYNADKIRGICELCNENIGEEIHHLQHQKDANDDGFIGSFHKNHSANLLTVCEKCHLKMHDMENQKDSKIPTVKKKTTKGYRVL